MTPLHEEPSAQSPWTSTIVGRAPLDMEESAGAIAPKPNETSSATTAATAAMSVRRDRRAGLRSSIVIGPFLIVRVPTVAHDHIAGVRGMRGHPDAVRGRVGGRRVR